MEISDEEEAEIPSTSSEYQNEFIDEQDSMIIDDKKATIAHVIIEELNENDVTNMDVNLEEFIDAVPLSVEQIESNLTFNDLENQPYDEENYEDNQEIPVSNLSFEMQEEALSDEEEEEEEEDRILTYEEQSMLTSQFLDGELTFSEYSIQMGRNITVEEIETQEPGSSR